MKSELTDHPFLATTALEEFWDKSTPIVFLGEWCLRYSRRDQWGPLGGAIVRGVWENTNNIYYTYRYISEVYEKILNELSLVLNEIHKVNFSTRYWRIVIGAWLWHYVHVLYDRYETLLIAVNDYPQFTTYLLADQNFVVPRNTLEYYQYTQDDPYNLQIYTKILTALGRDYERKNYSILPPIFTGSRKALFLNKIFKIFLNKNKIVLDTSYFNKTVALKILAGTLGKVVPYVPAIMNTPKLPLNLKIRTQLYNALPSNDAFMKVLKNMMHLDMPQSYLEAYEEIYNEVKVKYPVAPKAMVSSVSWYFDEYFKQWAASSAEKGTKLLGSQHGGNYGSLNFLATEDHELAITDIFYSWGWENASSPSKVVSMPAAKLSGQKILGVSRNHKHLLFVTANYPRYLCRLETQSLKKSEYIRWQIRFVSLISPEINPHLRLRLYQTDYGWDMRKRWPDLFPDMQLENWQKPFFRSLANCCLYVCDHLSTTFVEALAVNKPTILFWDPVINELREEAKPYYHALYATGILHHTPENAAQAVNSIYFDVENWWNDSTRQDARRFFCNRFAKTSANPVKEWILEFKRLSKSKD